MIHEDSVALQPQNLRTVLRALRKTAFAKQLGIAHLSEEADFETLFELFCSEAPVFEPRTYVDYIARLPEWAPDHESAFSMKHIAAPQKVECLARFRSGWVPYTRAMLNKYYALENKIYDAYKKDAGQKQNTIFHLFEEPSMDMRYNMHIGDVRTYWHMFRSYFRRKNFLPALKDLEATGKSRYQRLHSFVDILEKEGKKVDTLMGTPKIFTDLAMLVSQRMGKNVTMADICPNLKQVIYYGGTFTHYKYEFDIFLAGMDVRLVELYLNATGAIGYQPAIDSGRNLILTSQTDCFYTFVPVDDVQENGHPKRGYRYCHAGQLDVNGRYLLLVSNANGLVQINTGDIFRVTHDKPLLLQYERSTRSLHRFHEPLTEDAIDKSLAHLNRSLGGQGFFIRDYIAGDNYGERKTQWVLELSTSLQGITEQSLQSVANAFHAELSLQNPFYHKAYQENPMRVPEFIFVPMGTLGALPDRFTFHHLDTSENLLMIKAAMDIAWQKVVLNVRSL